MTGLPSEHFLAALDRVSIAIAMPRVAKGLSGVLEFFFERDKLAR